MDHLPRPKDPVRELEQIPYISTEEYDQLGFLDYPVRKGWSTDDGTLSESALSRPRDEINAFIQAYLWFGLGHEVLGSNFNCRNFTIVNREGVRVLSTVSLSSVGQQWMEARRRTMPNARQAKANHLIECLTRAMNTVIILDSSPHHGKLDGLIGRSILALAEALYVFIHHVFHKEVMMDGFQPNIFGFPMRLSFLKPYYKELFKQSQWCKSEWGYLKDTTSPISKLHYVSLLRPPKADFDHSTCDKSSCSAYRINPAVYETKHISPSCQCIKLELDPQDVGDILAQGDLPVLFLDTIEEDDGAERLQLRVEPWTPDIPYVAISHVWADGMGDPKANGLPACQLQKVKRLVDAMPYERLRWNCDGYKETPARPKPSTLRNAWKKQQPSHWLSRVFSTLRNIECKEVPTLNPRDVASAAHSIKDFILSSSRNKDLLDTLARLLLIGLGDRYLNPGGDFLPPEELGQDSALFEFLKVQLAEVLSRTSHMKDITAELAENDELKMDGQRLLSSIFMAAQRPMKEKANWHQGAGFVSGDQNSDPRTATAERPKKRAFWIDTICCPVRPMHLKLLAIARMKETYENAQHVLVIDSYLGSTKAAPLDDTEILMRTLVSGYMKRLWTLQEAVLAQSLWFQFEDGPVELRPLRWRWNDHGEPLHTVLRFDVSSMYESLVSLKNSEGHHESPLTAKLTTALRYRSVSVASDEAICIANLLQLNVDDIYKRNRNPTMEDIWKRMDLIPSDVIFSISPRLQTPGLRWAPGTFLGTSIQKGSYYRDMNYGTILSGGLEVCFPGLMLQSLIPEETNHFHIFYDTSDDGNTNGTRMWYCCSIPPSRRAANPEITDEARHSPVIILSDVPKAPKRPNDKRRTKALYGLLDRDLYLEESVAHVRARFVVDLAVLEEGDEVASTAQGIVKAVDQRLMALPEAGRDTLNQNSVRNHLIEVEMQEILAGHAKPDCLKSFVQEYYDLWFEMGYGLEAMRMGDEISTESQWIID